MVMLVSDEYFNNVLAPKYFLSNKMVALKVTNMCPVACDHCRENASMDNTGIVSKEVIDNVIDQIKNDGWVLCLQGGEPLILPETCEYIINKCNENGIATNLYTSGFWYKHCDILIPKILEWNPTIVCVSVNDWTVAKLGGLEYVNTIAKYFKKDDTPILLYSEVNLDGPKYKELVDIKTCTISYELAPVGRAKNLIGTYKAAGKMERWMGRDMCVLSGFEIGVDGTIYPNCCAAAGSSCRFGNIKNVELKSLLKMRKKFCDGF